MIAGSSRTQPFVTRRGWVPHRCPFSQPGLHPHGLETLCCRHAGIPTPWGLHSRPAQHTCGQQSRRPAARLHLGRMQPAGCSAARAAAATAADRMDSHDLLIVGPGVLGSYLGKLWLERYPAARVIGQTNTEANHDRLRSLGLEPRTKAAAGVERFPYVAFTAPPSGSSDYIGEAEAALRLWDGAGAFVFTGSAGVYAREDGSCVSEDGESAPLGRDERTDRLLRTEAAVLGAGGCVVRLAGLYHAQRGAHTFFLKVGKVPRWAGCTVNLIHYEDAAELAAAVLRGDGAEAPYRGRTFLGCDGAPLTFQEMMDATLASERYSGAVEFTGAEAGSKAGKRLGNAATRRQLGWAPRWASYQAFMVAGARDWYSSSQ